MIGDCKAFLARQAAEWNIPAHDDWKILFHNNYHSHHSNINLLWFNGGKYPLVATKLYREPEIPKREYENLDYAYRRAPRWVPRPLYFGVVGGFWTLWMAGVPGLRFWDPSVKKLRALAGEVAAMHAALVRPTGPASGRHERMVTTPVRALAEFGAADAVARGCAMLAETAAEPWLDSLPSIPQHGDLYLDNILSDRGRWHIVDWESFGVIDIPFYDLFTLLISRLTVDGDTPGRWERSLVREVPRLVEGYAQRLQLPLEQARPLLPLTLANWFYLQWLDGRRRFAERMYGMAGDYFERTAAWERVFFGGTGA